MRTLSIALICFVHLSEVESKGQTPTGMHSADGGNVDPNSLEVMNHHEIDFSGTFKSAEELAADLNKQKKQQPG